MRRIMLVTLAVVASACTGTTTPSTTTPTTPPPAESDTSPTTTGTTAATAPSTTATATTTTSASSTTAAAATTTTLGEGDPAIRIEEIVFAGEPYLIVGNLGSGPGSTGGYWICQFPNYYELPDVELQPGERLAVPLGAADVPDLIGVVATVDVTEPLGAVSAADGELGLYSSNEFNSADAIVDYVEWGSGGHARSTVATAAGIWTGGFVEVPAELLAIVAQAFPTAGPDDWFAEIGG